MSPASYQTAPPRDVFLWRAGNGTRTRDPNLGKVVLYQLSYSRVAHLTAKLGRRRPVRNHTQTGPGDDGEGGHPEPSVHIPLVPGSGGEGVCPEPPRTQIQRSRDGGEGNRTPDLVNASHALSQLSYAPLPPAVGPLARTRRGSQTSYRGARGVSISSRPVMNRSRTRV